MSNTREGADAVNRPWAVRGCRAAAWVCLALLSSVLTGCGSYVLRGVVVDGPVSAVLVVDDNDPRLGRQGVDGAVIETTVDPDAMKPKRLPKVMTDDAGRFEIPVSETGAGFLEYKIAVLCRAAGFQASFDTLKMPPNSRRLLIVMQAGRDTFRPAEDVIGESLKIGREVK